MQHTFVPQHKLMPAAGDVVKWNLRLHNYMLLLPAPSYCVPGCIRQVGLVGLQCQLFNITILFLYFVKSCCNIRVETK